MLYQQPQTDSIDSQLHSLADLVPSRMAGKSIADEKRIVFYPSGNPRLQAGFLHDITDDRLIVDDNSAYPRNPSGSRVLA